MSMSSVPHYQTKGAECIDILRDLLTPEEFEGYCKGCMVKYIYRAGDKQDKARDLAKAADYACMLAHDMWLSEVNANEVH